MAGVALRLPLPTLLSTALVAFTIEFDNEAEHQMPHRTTASGPSALVGDGPFLVSQVMWSNVMQYVTDTGVRVGDLHERARTTRDSLAGLRRWRYVVVEPDPLDSRVTPRSDDLIVRPTAGGRTAQQCWRPLGREIEGRWARRFGPERIGALRRALQSVLDRMPGDRPDYLPIVHPTQNGKAEIWEGPSASRRDDRSNDVSVLLSQVLLAFTIDFERQSRISLPISATTLRVLDREGTRVRDLPRLTGVSREANAMCIGFLVRHGCAVVGADPAAGRGKVVRPTAKGHRAQDKYRRILAATEEQWETHVGRQRIRDIRTSLEPLVGHEPLASRRRSTRG
jgi:DNA-binding MarR family transcriptional regulator